MARVICAIPGTPAEPINGIAFVLDRDELISEEIDDDTALSLASIPGYRLVAAKAETKAAKGKDAPVADAG